jgi:hypothetical protein
MAWESLGEIAPASGEWRTYPGVTPPASGAAVFRITPRNLSTGVIFKPYALLRFYSVQNGVDTVTRARRVYPRPESMVVEAEIPNELRDGVVQWFPQIKKEVYRRFIGSTNDGLWTIEVEHLNTDDFVEPEFVEIGEQLDQITNATDFLY